MGWHALADAERDLVLAIDVQPLGEATARSPEEFPRPVRATLFISCGGRRAQVRRSRRPDTAVCIAAVNHGPHDASRQDFFCFQLKQIAVDHCEVCRMTPLSSDGGTGRWPSAHLATGVAG
jgi:hypothetical protein